MISDYGTYLAASFSKFTFPSTVISKRSDTLCECLNSVRTRYNLILFSVMTIYSTFADMTQLA